MRREKGISPLIAATLLIAFTLTIAVLVEAFLTQTMKSAQQGQSEKIGDVLASSKASLEIQRVAYDSSSGNYTVTIQNTGSTALENFSAVITGEEIAQKRIAETLPEAEIMRFELATSNSQSQHDRLEVDSIQPAASDSETLTNVNSGSAPAAPTGLTATVK